MTPCSRLKSSFRVRCGLFNPLWVCNVLCNSGQKFNRCLNRLMQAGRYNIETRMGIWDANADAGAEADGWCVVWDSPAHSFGKWGDTYVCRMLYELEAAAVNISHIVAASDIIFNNLFSPLQHLPQRILITCLIICFRHSLSQGCDLGLAHHFLSLMPN